MKSVLFMAVVSLILTTGCDEKPKYRGSALPKKEANNAERTNTDVDQGDVTVPGEEAPEQASNGEELTGEQGSEESVIGSEEQGEKQPEFAGSVAADDAAKKDGVSETGEEETEEAEASSDAETVGSKAADDAAKKDGVSETGEEETEEAEASSDAETVGSKAADDAAKKDGVSETGEEEPEEAEASSDAETVGSKAADDAAKKDGVSETGEEEPEEAEASSDAETVGSKAADDAAKKDGVSETGEEETTEEEASSDSAAADKKAELIETWGDVRKQLAVIAELTEGIKGVAEETDENSAEVLKQRAALQEPLAEVAALQGKAMALETEVLSGQDELPNFQDSGALFTHIVDYETEQSVIDSQSFVFFVKDTGEAKNFYRLSTSQNYSFLKDTVLIEPLFSVAKNGDVLDCNTNLKSKMIVSDSDSHLKLDFSKSIDGLAEYVLAKSNNESAFDTLKTASLSEAIDKEASVSADGVNYEYSGSLCDKLNN